MIEVTGIRGRRRKWLLEDLKERRRYWKLVALCGELVLDRIRTCRETDCGMMKIQCNLMEHGRFVISTNR
jgi:hypothetical protein